MAHYAKIENNIVTEVVVSNYAFISQQSGDWLKTSYNTHGGIHLRGKTPLRKNFAGIGMVYDEDLDAFYTVQPYPSWTLDEEACLWVCPVELLDTEHLYTWDEDTLGWLPQEP